MFLHGLLSCGWWCFGCSVSAGCPSIPLFAQEMPDSAVQWCSVRDSPALLPYHTYTRARSGIVTICGFTIETKQTNPLSFIMYFPFLIIPPLGSCLIDLDGPVDLADEPERCEEADRAGEEEEGQGDHAHVGEVDEGGHGRVDVQLRDEVPK